MAFFNPRFIGVNRRRYGRLPADLSALDGLRGSVRAALPMRKTRTPRRLKVLPVRSRLIRISPVERPRGIVRL